MCVYTVKTSEDDVLSSRRCRRERENKSTEQKEENYHPFCWSRRPVDDMERVCIFDPIKLAGLGGATGPKVMRLFDIRPASRLLWPGVYYVKSVPYSHVVDLSFSLSHFLDRRLLLLSTLSPFSLYIFIYK